MWNLKVAMMFVLALGVSGCAKPTVSGSLCEHSNLFYFDNEKEIENTPDRPLRFIVSHNEVYSSFCVED